MFNKLYFNNINTLELQIRNTLRKKIYYWSPSVVNIATNTAVINSAFSIKKYSKIFDAEIINFFGEFDAIIAPSALGEAPLLSEGNTGNPVCSTIWSLCGLPCLTIPAFVSKNNMPIGVQLIGKPEFDDKLLGIGGWLMEKLNDHEVGILNNETN